ncbi:PepSY domain-containing protein [Sphingomonas sp. RHCKR7]|uniref:PepSY-associated TM helix domain-containing protein n=1 Tax=Sphingomonas folli TaxID=2862497 RepID=UPI001C67C7E5|nr:PepSY-associated TM helix domain-containing protein [Sphingomonas folli]MBW6528215.1 PepSY domain-containing protein [Sphingomonas folli]
MRALALLHRWVGAIVGALLALLGTTGALLVWRDPLTLVPHAGDAPLRDPATLARVLDSLAAGARPLDRVTLAGEGLGVHQVVFRDGGGAYLSQGGEVVARWSSAWQRPELLLFDLHHRLLLGEAGETVIGVAALVGLVLVVSGAVLWWRTRARFRPRPWPARMTSGAIVHHHRDLGVLTAPLLALSLLTGAMMALPAVERLLLAPLGASDRVRPPRLPATRPSAAPAPRLAPLLAAAAHRFPGAELRRVQWPRGARAPLALRLRQSFEWTPNGRTFVYADPVTLRIVGVADPAAGGAHERAREKLYPLHAAKVGGLAWKLAITASGLALALLGSLAVYGFWATRARVSAARRGRRAAAAG